MFNAVVGRRLRGFDATDIFVLAFVVAASSTNTCLRGVGYEPPASTDFARVAVHHFVPGMYYVYLVCKRDSNL